MTTQQTTPNDSRASGTPHSDTTNSTWGRPVAVLALGSFAMGTDSFVLAGILPQIAHGLKESTSAAGQVITAFALTYALAAPFLAAFTSKLPRKPLMAFALALFVVANLASAAAPTLPLLLAARVAAGFGAALYTPNASAAAAALAGPARRGQALAVILGGLTVGTVFGVPAGTAIGQHVSWQASLVFVAAVGLVALLGLLATLPNLPIPPAVPMSARLGVLARGRVLAMVGFMLLASASSIMVYTYIAKVLGETAHTTGTSLAVTLLVWGIGGTVGSFGSGWLTDRWGAHRTLLLAVGLLAVTLAALTVATSIVPVMIVMALNGAAGWAVATPNNHRLTALVPELPSVVISFNSSGIYLGQAVGAGLGGILLGHGMAVRPFCIAGAVIAVVAIALHLLISRSAKEVRTA
ncbi:MFS transporter [Kitasatospora atroaurantiaca]|uniref:Putative MFS family arabinose efflux permease n=1 Tax=Kitasatospora atroaurantiaca TaxID=285545 RepID=A0A561EXU5_9ACTN|nr:MFS transporter [Kitasatospora atroaurantiaca]TWE20397.1 putative MFS family arabinose efflux permease [Kitasatospora atroaurantiaca]